MEGRFPSRALIRGALVVTILAVVWAVSPAESRPLYAARTGMACSSCHVNPSGAWMRNTTGFAYALNGHTMTPAEEPTQTIDPKVSDGIRLGGDLRSIYIQEYHRTSSNQSTFLTMSAILFAEASLNNRYSIYYSNDQGRTFETYAIVRNLPFLTTLKVGRFRPTYGVNEEDHTTFTQDSLGVGLFSEDTGIEVTRDHKICHVTLGLLNGSTSPLLDNNPQKAATGRVWVYGSHMGLGMTGYSNVPQRYQRLLRYGVIGNAHVGPLVFLGEYDRGETRYNDPAANGRETVRLEAGFAELSYQIDEGPTVKVKYDRFDHDLDVADNARDRMGLWFETDLAPFTRFIGAARGTRTYADSRTVYDVLAQLYLYF
jgi:hypothetical protein